MQNNKKEFTISNNTYDLSKTKDIEALKGVFEKSNATFLNSLLTDARQKQLVEAELLKTTNAEYTAESIRKEILKNLNGLSKNIDKSQMEHQVYTANSIVNEEPIKTSVIMESKASLATSQVSEIVGVNTKSVVTTESKNEKDTEPNEIKDENLKKITSQIPSKEALSRVEEYQLEKSIIQSAVVEALNASTNKEEFIAKISSIIPNEKDIKDIKVEASKLYDEKEKEEKIANSSSVSSKGKQPETIKAVFEIQAEKHARSFLDAMKRLVNKVAKAIGVKEPFSAKVINERENITNTLSL